ncbi:hypothetical protein DFS28_103537 [Pseudomonas sp. 478]|jgi:hypothetical protein|uniref:DUF6124 family protein n=1 Tax=unclassified Pseudomonas TaxID=196821 RepID=UPI000DAB9E80|nr:MULTISPECIES: DUF6124 family protein [unclassified Pseudomonas]PZW99461.1 hypothetical protein DFS28_103537 [Pseudomonas sp. 478]TCV48997.1 hypothetical protein EDB99_11323 [Pseudomonas sp. 460]
MFKPTPNPPDNSGAPSEDPIEAEKLKEAADRAFAHYFPPTTEKPPRHRKGHLFTVAPEVNTETLLANAAEDLLSISAIAANLADEVDGTRRSVALALSRMADGVQLLVERVQDHWDESEIMQARVKV